MAADRAQVLEHCRGLVQAHDNDRYLSSLFAPEQGRGDLWALYAFNYEISRLRETVKEPIAGEIRLKWWEDAIEAIYRGEKVNGHPVAMALGDTIERTGLPRLLMKKLVDARRFDLYDDAMADMEALETYLADTSGALIALACRVLAGPPAAPVSAAAGHAGLAWGLTGLLRALPVARSRGQCYIPADLLEKRELTPAHVLSGRGAAGLGLILSQLRHQARRELGLARDGLSGLKLGVLPAFLHVALVEDYLKKLDNESFDPFNQVATVSRLKKQWRLMYKSFSEEF